MAFHRNHLYLAALLFACCGPAAAAAQESRTGACKLGATSFFRDEGLTIKLSTKLQFNKLLMREKFDVKVSGGVATLSGGLTTGDQIAAAMAIAREVEGISCINNMLRVGPPEPAGAPPG